MWGKLKRHLQQNMTVSVVIGGIVFVGIAMVTKLFSTDDFPLRISGALLEAVVTAFITYFLLTGQTQQEGLKETEVKIFEKKQEVYHAFLEKLKEIIRDGEITIGSRSTDGEIDNSVDELKELIFQLGFLQMHTSKENIEKILGKVAEIIQTMNDFSYADGAEKQKDTSRFYASLSEQVFFIISILKSDLYGKESLPIKKEKMKEILDNCGLYVETKDFSRHEISRYFWDELQKQLKGKEYDIEYKNFTTEIDTYYSDSKKRRDAGRLGFNICKFGELDVELFIKVQGNGLIVYGFSNLKDETENTLLNKRLYEKTNAFQKYRNQSIGYRYPKDELQLNFQTLDSPGFDELKNPNKREKFIERLIDEIETYIELMREVCKAR